MPYSKQQIMQMPSLSILLVFLIKCALFKHETCDNATNEIENSVQLRIQSEQHML